MDFRRILSQASLVIGALLFSVGLQALAFTQPTTSTSDAGAFAPINTGPAGQIKSGGLILNTGGAAHGLIVDNGSVGIGSSVPKGTLDITTATSSPALYVNQTGSGDIFNAQWNRISRFIVKNNGNVGIGTTNPQEKLDVLGNIRVSGSVTLGEGNIVYEMPPGCGGGVTFAQTCKTLLAGGSTSAGCQVVQYGGGRGGSLRADVTYTSFNPIFYDCTGNSNQGSSLTCSTTPKGRMPY